MDPDPVPPTRPTPPPMPHTIMGEYASLYRPRYGVSWDMDDTAVVTRSNISLRNGDSHLGQTQGVRAIIGEEVLKLVEEGRIFIGPDGKLAVCRNLGKP
jgi:hypothetical protein